MEQRRTIGKGHWYHETQSSLCPTEPLPLVPEAAQVDDPFCLDLALPATLNPDAPWLLHARKLAHSLLPDAVDISRFHTLSSYDRLSTALTVAQVYGVQRLCNHYAARLAPQPGPDSSRESNHRLTQITQYARLLASQPTLITSRSRKQLEDVGLSSADIITFHHVIGFVGFQARAIAVLQAINNIAVRLLPGIDNQQEADAALFLGPSRVWRAGIAVRNTLSPATVTPSLAPLAGVLAWDDTTLPSLNALTATLMLDDTPGVLCEILSARLNGCVARFDSACARWQGDPLLVQAMRNGEQALQSWGAEFTRERTLIQALRVLTLTPERVTHCTLEGLRAFMATDEDIWRLCAWCGLCGWLDRLYGGPGDAD